MTLKNSIDKIIFHFYFSSVTGGGGGEGSWGSGSPLLGDPKLHKAGKNVAHMRANAICISN